MTKELKTKAVKIVEKLLASQKERADFLNDTEAYLKSAKVDLDENVVSEIKLALEELDKKFLECSRCCIRSSSCCNSCYKHGGS